jgi:hypothetical protein
MVLARTDGKFPTVEAELGRLSVTGKSSGLETNSVYTPVYESIWICTRVHQAFSPSASEGVRLLVDEL